jgi:3' exoribonuclease, RNase T-like
MLIPLETGRAPQHKEASAPLRIWFDTEFFDDGHHIQLISLGLVASDGREYYAENAAFKRAGATPWLQANVLPYLQAGTEKSTSQIAADLRHFVGTATPEFWAYFGEYDWIVLRQLFGDLMAWPAGWPLSHMNLEQWRLHLGEPALPKQTHNVHHALADAKWLQQAWVHLQGLATEGPQPRPTQR